jgi:hypothetical protein
MTAETINADVEFLMALPGVELRRLYNAARRAYRKSGRGQELTNEEEIALYKGRLLQAQVTANLGQKPAYIGHVDDWYFVFTDYGIAIRQKYGQTPAVIDHTFLPGRMNGYSIHLYHFEELQAD